MTATITDIVKAVIEYQQLVEETTKPYYQGYDFIDSVLLGVHCPTIHKLTIDETIELVKALGYVVILPSEFELAPEVTFSLKASMTEERLKERIKTYMEDEGMM